MPRNDPVLLAIERFVLCEEVGIPNGLLNEERLGPNLPQMLDNVLERRERLAKQRKRLHVRCRRGYGTKEL